jgi:hypothetical protein
MAKSNISTNWEPTQSNSSLNTGGSENLIVIDTCSNKLVFTKNDDDSVTFEYKPTEPSNSCSGTYSGGTPVFKNLESGKWTKLLTAFDSAKIKGKHRKGRYK